MSLPSGSYGVLWDERVQRPSLEFRFGLSGNVVKKADYGKQIRVYYSVLLGTPRRHQNT